MQKGPLAKSRPMPKARKETQAIRLAGETRPAKTSGRKARPPLQEKTRPSRTRPSGASRVARRVASRLPAMKARTMLPYHSP